MAHNIYDERFYSHREPAWHRLGIVSQESRNAIEVGKMIEIPIIREMDIAAIDSPYYHQIPLPDHKVIMGTTTENDQQVNRAYAVVSKDYAVISHQSFIEMFHEATGSHVETMGLLGGGETLFLTAPMSTIDVAGDEVINYLLALNPLNGVEAIQARTTSIRVVCQNTLMISLNRKTDHEIRLRHRTKNAREKIQTWLNIVWNQTSEMTHLMQEAYEGMANIRLMPDQVGEFLEYIYAEPDCPDPEDANEEMMANWQKEAKTQFNHQSAVLDLFEGSRTNNPKSAGTAWRLYNAFVEYEDFARPRGRASSQVFGSSAKRKIDAFHKLQTINM